MTGIILKTCIKRPQSVLQMFVSHKFPFTPFVLSWISSSNIHFPRYTETVIARHKSVYLKQKEPRQTLKKKQSTHADYPFMPLLAAQQVYVLDEALADDIVRALLEHKMHQDVPLLESNPGPGVLTRKLFESGFKKIIAVEALEGFLPYLKELQNTVDKDALIVFHWQYVSASLPQWNPETLCDQHTDSLASLVSAGKKMHNPPLTVLSILPHRKEGEFFKCLLTHFSSQQGLFTVGSPEWFVLIPPLFYQNLVVAAMDENRPTKKFTNLAIVLLLFFDVKLCAKFPGCKFTPSFPERRKKYVAQTVLPEVEDAVRYLVHFRPRSDPALAPTQIPAFYSFLKQVMHKRKDRFIPKMEQLISGCGIHLIVLGITMMTKTGDLPLAMLVDIYKIMQTWPEYKGSPMMQYLSDNTMSPHQEDPSDDS